MHTSEFVWKGNFRLCVPRLRPVCLELRNFEQEIGIFSYQVHRVQYRPEGGRGSTALWTTRARPASGLPLYVMQDTGTAPTSSATKFGLWFNDWIRSRWPWTEGKCGEKKGQGRSCQYFHINGKCLLYNSKQQCSYYMLWCSERLIFFYIKVKPLDYAVHIVPMRCYILYFSL